VEVKAFVIEGGDGVANDLVGEFADRFARQSLIGLGDFNSGQTAGELQCCPKLDIKNDPPFDLAREANFGSDSVPPVRLFFHSQVLDENGRPQPLRQNGVGRIDERLN